MALKKPDELFEKKKGVVKNTPLTFNENVNNIKTQFNKVDALKKQLEDVSVSLNNSLTEVVDNNVNLISFKTEYDDLLNGLNNKIEKVKEEFSNEVKEIKKYQSNLSAEVTIIEQRQKKAKLNGLKEEIIIDVKNLLSGNVLNNIKNLEEKVDLINEKHIKRLNESYSEPPNVKNSDPLTPTDQKFVNLDDFQNHYRLFLNRIQRQLSTLGGGGAVLISDLDDVETSTAKVNGKYLRYNSTKGKWEGADASGGGGGGSLSTEEVQDIVGAMFTNNTETNITATYQDSDGTIDLVSTDTNTQLSTEEVQDIVGAMFTNNTETNITATYQDSDGTIDLVASGGGGGGGLSTEEVQDIVGAMFTGNTETNITATYQDSDGTIDLSSTDTNTQLSTEEVQDIVGAMFTNNTETNITATYQDSDGTIDLIASGGGGGISNIVEDTSPPLGGNLDVQSREINTSASNGNIKLTPNGSGCVEIKGASGNDGTIQLNCSVNSHGVKIKSPPHSAGATYTLTLPENDGGAGEFLRSNGSGVLSWASAGGLSSRTTTSASTGSIAQTASANITIPTAGKSFSLLKVAISAPAYVVLYVDSASRSSDSSRSEGTDPAPGAGVLAEVSTTTSGASTFLMSPAVLGWNNDSTPASQIYAKVVNKRATSGSNAITVTLTSVALEA